MTKLPASVLGLNDRGEIKTGFWADVIIFDPNSIIDHATFVAPHQYPSGISYVLVNGRIAINHGKYTDSLPGKVLKKYLKI